jgi:hypothetical protein
MQDFAITKIWEKALGLILTNGLKEQNNYSLIV